MNPIIDWIKWNKGPAITITVLSLIAIGLFTWWWNMPRIIARYNIEVVEKIHEPYRTFTKEESRRYACGVYIGTNASGNMTTKTRYCTSHWLVTYEDDEDWVAIVKQKQVYDNGHVEYKMIRQYVHPELWEKVIEGKPFQTHWGLEDKNKKGDRPVKIGEKEV